MLTCYHAKTYTTEAELLQNSLIEIINSQGSHHGHNAREKTEAEEAPLALLQDRRAQAHSAPQEDR